MAQLTLIIMNTAYVDQSKVKEQGHYFVLDHEFTMSQLDDRQRKVWMYLPPDYDASDKSYPVIYAQDGQNLFDPNASFAGEWQLDKTLDRLYKSGDWGAIVVGIENSRNGETRINEYSAWHNPHLELGGDGHQYLEFIIGTVKPHIDYHFRTRTDRTNTLILGSSMGGLIALYAAVERPDIFGRAAVFSPSLWFAQAAFQHISDTGRKLPTKFYLLGGQQEGSQMAERLQWLNDTLVYAGFQAGEVFLELIADGQHSEWFWAREFEKAYRWLLG